MSFHRTYQVGDDATQDLSILVPASGSLPANISIKRALVRTGKYRPGDEDKVAALGGQDTGDRSAVVVKDSFASWVDGFLSGQEETRAS